MAGVHANPEIQGNEVGEGCQQKPTSCLPEKLPLFTARIVEIQKVIEFLNGEERALVSLHGGPGFGKTAIAIEVSHKLDEDPNIFVVFSQLITAKTIEEMIRQLCLDVGVNYEDDPKRSLIFKLKNIEQQVILVMDNIDNLLVMSRSDFDNFVCMLRKNSNCQIITTSRMSYSIRALLMGSVDVKEMKDEECTELLKKQCSKQDDSFLRRLAELCGKIPLALCIAGSRVDDFDNSNEFLQHLERKPLKTLESPQSNEYVDRAISSSYEMLTDEEKDVFGRLSVFVGSFDEKAARAVIEKDSLDTNRILKNLESRSLIKQPTKHRYSIHLLINHFLRHQQHSNHDNAKQLMVAYYLNLGHDLTIKSYSKDGYKSNREALKEEAHNIQNVLKICCQDKDRTSDHLTNSEIYTSSARVFSLFVRTIISGSVVDEFLQRCANLAEERKQDEIKINFDCLLADQERIKSIGKPDEHYILKMEEIKKDFETHYEELKQDKSLCAHYYYQHGRYLSRMSNRCKERLDMNIQARGQLQESLKLRETLTDTSVGIADKVFSLLHLGKKCQLISASQYHLKKSEESKQSLEQAKQHYLHAIRLCQVHLGDHELTSTSQKYMGDLLLLNRSTLNDARKYYINAKQMRENLGLDSSERHVLLLNNLGKCFTKTKSLHEAIKVLEFARDMAEKLAENEEPNTCKTKVYASLAIAYDSHQKSCQDALKYAEKAMEFDGLKDLIKKSDYDRLQKMLPHRN